MKKLFTKISAIALALTLTASTSSGLTNITINNEFQTSTSITADAGKDIPASVIIKGDNINIKSANYYEPLLKNNQGYELWLETNGDMYIRNANKKSKYYNTRKNLIDHTKFRTDIKVYRSGEPQSMLLNFQQDGNLVLYANRNTVGWNKPLSHSNSYQPESMLSKKGYEYTYLLLGDTLYIQQKTPSGKINIIFNSKRDQFDYCY